eukprot:g38185.t1
MEENALDQDDKNAIQTDSKAANATKSPKGSEAEKNSKDKKAGTRSGMFGRELPYISESGVNYDGDCLGVHESDYFRFGLLRPAESAVLKRPWAPPNVLGLLRDDPVGRRGKIHLRWTWPLADEGENPPGADGKRSFDLVFCLEADVDPVATKRDWKDHLGALKDEFINEFINPLLAPHVFAANHAWPEAVPLPKIVHIRGHPAGSPPISPARAVVAGDNGSASQATSSLPSSNSRPRRSTTLPKWEWGILDLHHRSKPRKGSFFGGRLRLQRLWRRYPSMLLRVQLRYVAAASTAGKCVQAVTGQTSSYVTPKITCEPATCDNGVVARALPAGGQLEACPNHGQWTDKPSSCVLKCSLGHALVARTTGL